MTAFTEKLDRAAGAATCAVLEVGGASLIGTGVVSLPAGGVVPLAVGVAAVMASSYLNCSGWDPNKPGPDPTGPPIDYCAAAASPTTIWTFRNGLNDNVTAPVSVITKFDFDYRETEASGVTREYYDFRGTTPQGAAYRTELVLYSGPEDTSYFEQRFEGDPTCEVPITPGDKPIPVPPYDYTDPEDGCELTVNFEGFASGSIPADL